MIKKVLFVVLGLVVIAVAGLILSLDSLVRNGVEVAGSGALKTKTTLSAANVSLTGGAVILQDLVIANPKGFQTPNAFQVGAVELDASVPSFASDLVEIEKIVIDSPEITLDFASGNSNLGTLLDQLRGEGTASSSDEGATSTEPASDDAGGSKKLKVQLVQLRKPRLRVAESLLGVGQTEWTLPDLELTDIGSDGQGNSEGTTVAGLFETILTELQKAIASNQGLLPSELTDKLSSLGKDFEELGLNKIGDAVGDDLEEGGKALQDAANEAGNRLKGLLGGDK